MRKFLYLTMLAIFAAGCSSSSNVASDNSSKNASNAANKIVAANPSPNAAVNQAIPPPPSEINDNAEKPINLSNSFVDGSSISRRNLERLRSKGGGDKNAEPIASSPPAPHIAPDKSEISSTMDGKGVPIETRVFRNHPILAKTEKTFADIENPILKVYLKNGKVLTVPKGVTIDHLKAPAEDFLRAVGVNP